MKILSLIVVSVLVAACVTPPPGPPRVVATRIIQDLDAGKTDQAAALFARVSGDPEYRERIYPVVYEAAKKRYAAQDSATALPLLRFLTQNYGRSTAARQALVYSLFIERGKRSSDDSEATEELGKELKALLDHTTDPPIWLSLVQTQQAIDVGKLDAARDHFTRFQSAWDGRPEGLAVYVDDLQRYLNTH